jgi:pimeloyl-ACP methyl ester carboxylesterase
VVELKKRMKGELLSYTSGEARHCLFRCDAGDAKPVGAVVFVGGLGDGLLAVDYLEALQESLQRNQPDWTLVQLLMASSYGGFGVSSIEQDVQDIECALAKLTDCGFKHFVLVGHSTGCQDAVAFLRKRADSNSKHNVIGAVLQAPVSDRLYIASEDPDKHAKLMAKCAQMVTEGRGDELLPIDTFFAPITAARYSSLGGRLTADDLFSPDLTDEELKSTLGHMPSQVNEVLWVFSGGDEYVPDIAEQEKLGARIVALLDSPASPSHGRVRCITIPDANHSLSEPHDIAFVEAVMAHVNYVVTDEEQA